MDRFNQIEEGIRIMEGGRFQKLCDRYLHQKYGWELNTPGSMDGSNKTTAGTPDSYLHDISDSYILMMYGTRQDSEKKLMSDIDDAKTKAKLPKNKIKGIVCCYAGSNISAEENNKLVEYAKPYRLKLISSTTIANDLLDEYHSLALDFFDLPKWTDQINSFDKFINKHDKSKLMLHYQHPILIKMID
ncbi:hypothetical protein WR164_02510 [Philodulcilactobacillus myokoensis]|uniref:Uncharacterized protein n=1 Tax=Philodulcilactobacillus myokoensis TaxID=2929573 RepID=A0A9W6AZT7_9LACO|nr:hypothetical protein [Philodulcilactobacillus myokoensis]GLB46272.1 hypothetical protein WR164_02510 [Philodulcilactobacillus myokoensis]